MNEGRKDEKKHNGQGETESGDLWHVNLVQVAS